MTGDQLWDQFIKAGAKAELAENSSKVADPPDLSFGVDKVLPIGRDLLKIGRNDACPCGSGKKYKKCCGA